MSASPIWPEGKRFAFTVVDDTDLSTVDNVAPVYRLLKECGMRTTKTVWVYPSRDRFTGGCLQDPDYLSFVKQLQTDGFEIGMHGVGGGAFSREEIIEGLELFKEYLGDYPSMHINHSFNPDNLYWGYKRFAFPVRQIVNMLSRRDVFYGDEVDSPHYWGDHAKKHIKYSRNHVVNGINTLAFDPRMPYRVRSKSAASNGWFSSSDGHTLEEFVHLLSGGNVDYLERSGGCCILYTHFACDFVKDGAVDPAFESAIRNLASRNGWFVPASEVLDHLASFNPDQSPISYAYQLGLDLKWLMDRVLKKIRFGK